MSSYKSVLLLAIASMLLAVPVYGQSSWTQRDMNALVGGSTPAPGNPAYHVSSSVIIIVYKDTNSYLNRIWYRNGSWVSDNISADLSYDIPPVDFNASTVFANGINAIVYTAGNNSSPNLVEVWTPTLNSGWDVRYFGNFGNTLADATGTPSIWTNGTKSVIEYQISNDDGQDIGGMGQFGTVGNNWVFTDGSLYTHNCYSAFSNPQIVQLSTGLNIAATNGGDIYQLTNTSGNNDFDCTDVTVAAGAPFDAQANVDVALYASTSLRVIDYLGRSGHIKMLWFDTSWHYTDLNVISGGAPVSAGRPSVGINGSYDAVAYRGSDNHIYLQWAPIGKACKWIDLVTTTGAPLAAGEPTVGVNGSQISLVYVGTDGHIHQIYNAK